MTLLTITLTQGLPGSGKTTWAEEQALRTGAVALGLDRIRQQLHGGWRGDQRSEAEACLARCERAAALLRAGVSVIADDVGLDPDYTAPLVDLASRFGAALVVESRFLRVPIAECIRRDLLRAERLRVEPVGAAAIRSLADRFLNPDLTPKFPITLGGRPHAAVHS